MITKEDTSESEMMIICFCIMNDSVISSAFMRYKAQELKTKHFSEFFRPLFRSIINFYGKYDKAPKYTIEEIFRRLKSDKESKEIMETYLESMAEEYARIQDNVSIDVDYVIKEIIPGFIKEQEGHIVLEQIENALNAGKTHLIDEAIENYVRVSDIEEDETLGTATPYSQEAIDNFYLEDKKEKVIVRLDGAIGQLIPPFYVKKLTAITGVEKSGKTTTAADIAYQGIVKENANTLWINCEMDEDDLNELFWRRLTMTASDREHAGTVVYPVFDCQNNQLDRCEILKRSLNGDRLYNSVKEISSYEKNKSWKICTKCRGNKRFWKETKYFQPAIWFDQMRLKIIRRRMIQKAIEANKFIKLHKIRIKTFPRLAVKLSDVENYIKNYIKKTGFKPKLLVIDYPDIIAPEEGKLLDRQNVDFIWKKIAGLTHELECSTIVPDQAVKKARNQDSITRDDTSESKTKDAHLDTRITLNMNNAEEQLGIARYGLLYRRKGRTTSGQVMSLQRRETGEMMVDTEWWPYKKQKYYVCKTEKDKGNDDNQES